MRDLTQIPGIGAAVARRLRKAGIATVADLAGANADDLAANPALQGPGFVPGDLPVWIAAAKAMADPSSLEDARARHDALVRIRLLNRVDHDGAQFPSGTEGLWPPELAAQLIAAGAAIEAPRADTGAPGEPSDGS